MPDNESATESFVITTNIPPVVVGGVEYSRGQIAQGTGISISHISKVFSGRRRPSLTSALRIATFLGISVEFLLARVLPSVRRAHPRNRPLKSTTQL